MNEEQRFSVFIAQCVLLAAAAMITFPGNARAPAQTPYSAPGHWTVTTYRAGDTGAFLPGSAERHYENGSTLTVAKNAVGKFVLGFTSDQWTYEDRSTYAVSIHVDSRGEVSLRGCVRILPVGPIILVDVDMGGTVIADISADNTLYANTAETSAEMNLAGSGAAIASNNRYHLDVID